MTDDRTAAQAAAHHLIDGIGSRSAAAVVASIDRLTEPGRAERLRGVLAELLAVTAAAVTAQAGPAHGRAYVLDLHDGDGVPVSVDELAPPVRALTRALLAELAGHRGDAAEQLRLALATGSRSDAARVLTMCLLWTVDAITRASR